MRFLSSEGWNEKSKPARVLMAESRAIHLHAQVLAQGEFLGKQRVDGFEGVHFAALDPAHHGVEDFDGAWHFQANQAPLDAVDDGGDDLGMRGHRVLPRPARRRPTAS